MPRALVNLHTALQQARFTEISQARSGIPQQQGKQPLAETKYDAFVPSTHYQELYLSNTPYHFVSDSSKLWPTTITMATSDNPLPSLGFDMTSAVANSDNMTTASLIANLAYSDPVTTRSPDTTSLTCPERVLFVSIVVIPIVCILGLIGNTLSMVILAADRHNSATSVLLMALAVMDDVVLVTSLLRRPLPALCKLYDISERFCAVRASYLELVMRPTFHIAHMATTWTTVQVGSGMSPFWRKLRRHWLHLKWSFWNLPCSQWLSQQLYFLRTFQKRCSQTIKKFSCNVPITSRCKVNFEEMFPESYWETLREHFFVFSCNLKGTTPGGFCLTSR